MWRSSLSWNCQIRDSDSSLVSCLISRINALSKVCSYSNFQTRKNMANGMVMTYLTYLIPLYGGCPDYLLKSLQVLQNRAARLATRSAWGTASFIMLQQLGWLSVRQMIVFHTLMLFYKVKLYKKPSYLYSQISHKFNANTRLGRNNGIKEHRRVKSTLARNSCIPRTINHWNSLPPSLRMAPNIQHLDLNFEMWWRTIFDLSPHFWLA